MNSSPESILDVDSGVYSHVQHLNFMKGNAIMKPIISFKNTANGFKIAFSFYHNEKEYPIRHIFSSESLVESFYLLCCKDEYLYSLWQNETIFDQRQISNDEIFAILNKWNHYTELGFEIRVPNTVSRETKIKIATKTNSKKKMITKLSIDGLELSDDVIAAIKQSLKDYIFFNGKWRAIDANMIKSLSDNDLNITKALQALKASKGIFQPDNISIENMPIPCDPVPYRCDVKAELREYQQQAIEMLYGAFNRKQNILLADDMGLGKTLTIISLLNILNNADKAPNLVIVPKTLTGNWCKELEKFSPDVSHAIVKNKIDGKHNTYITTYGHVLNNPEIYLAVNWNLIVLDEAQQIKNSHTQQSKIVCSLKSNHKIAMTGTPIENSVMDLWSIFKFLDEELLGHEKEFKQLVDSDDSLNRLHSLLSPYIIRRVKSDKSLGLDLPEKHEHVIYCDLTDEQIALYNAVIEQFENEVKLARRLNKRVTVLKYINLLKLICSDYKAILPDYKDNMPSGKVNALIRYLMGINKDKIILFTQYRQIADNLNNILASFYGKQGLVIDGKLSAKKRTKIANEFQTGNYPFLILTLKAGNSGLTLTEACHVIHFDRWWNPSVENQATDRSHRIGQTRDVHVVKFVTKGTLEERIHDILKDKVKLFDQVISPLNMSSEEVLDFVKLKLGDKNAK